MKSFFEKHRNKILIGLLVVLSVVAWCVSYSQQWVLAYNDSMSHLNMARLVFDNRKPGAAQIGSVWLPLSHILALPLVWMDWAWRSGFAGSIVSMISFVCTVIGIFAIIFELSGKRLAAFVGAAVAALNLNMLYLQTTPLTEPLYVALFVGSAYFLVRYVKTSDVKYLLPLAFITALQIMTRYDGWFVAVAIGVSLLLFEMKARGLSFGKALGNVLVYALPVIFAGMVWIGWNAVIFDDPLYFATGPFSAQAQQQVIEHQSGLATKGNIMTSLQAVGYSSADNVGWLILNAALIGWLAYLNPFTTRQVALRMVVISVLGSVLVFNVIALFLGFSILNVPELSLGSTSNISDSMFNVRYGILALPFVAVGIGLLVAQFIQQGRYYTVPLMITVIVVQAFVIYGETPITLQDGQVGASAFVERGLADELKKNVSNSDDVLMSMSYFNPVAHASGLDLKRFVHEGASRQWESALSEPQKNIEWIVMSNGNGADPVYKKLYEQNKTNLESHYSLQYQDKHSRLYHLSSATVLK